LSLLKYTYDLLIFFKQNAVLFTFKINFFRIFWKFPNLICSHVFNSMMLRFSLTELLDSVEILNKIEFLKIWFSMLSIELSWEIICAIWISVGLSISTPILINLKCLIMYLKTTSAYISLFWLVSKTYFLIAIEIYIKRHLIESFWIFLNFEPSVESKVSLLFLKWWLQIKRAAPTIASSASLVETYDC